VGAFQHRYTSAVEISRGRSGVYLIVIVSPNWPGGDGKNHWVVIRQNSKFGNG
jgi:hypothetical protein